MEDTKVTQSNVKIFPRDSLQANAVNLARTIFEGDMQSDGITQKGILLLVEAVLYLDAVVTESRKNKP